MTVKTKTSNRIANDIAEAQKGSDIDGFIDKFILEPVAMIFSHLFIKMKFTPNMVTILSLIFGVAGGVLFYFNDLSLTVIGIVLFFLGAVFDTSDGQVARLTKKSSQFGRILDGVCDGIVQIAMYLAVAFRIMSQNIPFTQIQWNYYIWPIAVYTGLVAHRRQCCMADYYRNLHLLFLKNKNGSEFDRTKKIDEDISMLSEHDSLIRKLYLKSYRSYTAGQEKNSPKLQILLDEIEKHENVISDEMKKDFLNKSSEFIKYTGLLTFNFRTVALFISVLLNLQIWFFVFVLTVMEIMRLKMSNGYEKIAENLTAKYYGENK